MEFGKTVSRHEADVGVVGGGLAGIGAAGAAARHGARVVLMHDRPVRGGNASSEIRMWVRGAPGPENRETGILSEIEMENIYRNPTMNFSLWDTVLYQIVREEPHLELLLNCSCLGCEMVGEAIQKVAGWQLNTYTLHEVAAACFIDCSGDSILAPLSGAQHRIGREAAAEFGEYAAPEMADGRTMGSSLLLQARETDHPCPFIPPPWACVYPTDEDMRLHSHEVTPSGTNFWWIEVGGTLDAIRDAQTIHEELLRIVYGVWDHLKNQGDHGLDRWELEWAGFLPGKRESRRYVGPRVLTQRDLEEGSHFPNTVAYGGWTMDNHDPLGFYHMGYSSRHVQVKVPYEIPLDCLYSVNVPNLLFAGRNISATHMALSSTRVMATCALLGQAAGTCGALAARLGCQPAEVDRCHIGTVQRLLLDDGCYLPGILRKPAPLTYTLPQEEAAVLQNGWERPQGGAANTVALTPGQELRLSGRGTLRGTLRLALDTDFSRESVTDVPAYRKFAMRSHIALDAAPLRMPQNMLRDGRITFLLEEGEHSIEIRDCRKPWLFLDIPKGTREIILHDMRSWSGAEVRLFACDIIERDFGGGHGD